MPREIGLAIVIAVGAGLLVLMLVSWRRKQARQAGLGTPSSVPADPGATVLETGGLYLATTPAGRRLDRIAIAPLGFRADAALTVTGRGLVVALTGSAPFFIAAEDVTAARRASWTIDRGVEEDGLNLIAWTLRGDAGERTELESYFRLREPRAFDDAVATIATHSEGMSA